MKNFIIFCYWEADGTATYISCTSMAEVHEWYAAQKEAERFIDKEIEREHLSKKASTLVAKHQRVRIKRLTQLVTEGFIYPS